MVDLHEHIEAALISALQHDSTVEMPPKLDAAMRHAVFPGGARIRPQLVLAVAFANDSTDPKPALAAAAAIELLHCASLVHDDMPCFDNADTRRGRPSVHSAFGERLAVLAGDALIVAAFQTIGEVINHAPGKAAEIMRIVAQGVGMPSGIVAGQAWECESEVSLSDYHRAKTGALFAAATMAGAAAAGVDAGPWRALGERLGEAYQVADDLHDVATESSRMGKPNGQDALLGRPSAVADLGLEGAAEKLLLLVEKAVDSIPECTKADDLRQLVAKESKRFLPQSLARQVA